MEELDKASARLMQPAKDIADWNFPLAATLEEYYTLLKEQDDVNFSNAALVLQNSVNVYVRRVEYLFNDTSSLIETFAELESVEKERQEKKRGAKNKNALIDFGDFEAIDFATFVGKNINIKVRNGINKSVKLLSQRFPQLENVSKSSTSIDVYDIYGEVIGKKYDFRCNEYLTASGMLVEHLTPQDFPNDFLDLSENIPAALPNSSIDLLTGGETTRTVVETESGILEHDLYQDNCDELCAVHDKETALLDTSFASSFDSGMGSSIQNSSARPDSSFSTFAENHWESSQSRPGSSMSTADTNSLGGADPPPLDCSQNDSVSSEQNEQSSEKTTAEVENSSAGDHRTTEEKGDTGDSTAAGQVDGSSDDPKQVAVPHVRRSKRSKNAIDAVNELNPQPWEPIPFNGVPDKLPRTRSEFKLPCPISLLKFKERTRKRKITPEMQEKRCLKKLSLSECGTAQKKMTMYSPTRQLFHPFKKEEVEDFQTFVERLNYEAITDPSLNLLGYRTTLRKSDSETIARADSGLKTSIPKPDPVIHSGIAATSEPPEVVESVEPVDDDFPMPDTPESSDSSSEISPSTTLPTYRSRVEQSLREFYDSADVRTTEKDAVAQWHEYMKPKLKEIERKPPFDIKRYSARILEKVKAQNGREIEFNEMVHDQPEPTEVARYFMASLQLANKYQLHIDTSRSVEGNFTLALLNKDR